MKKISIILSILTVSLLAESIISINSVSVVATGLEEKVIDQALSIVTKQESEIKLDQVLFQKDLLNSLAGVRIEQTGSVIGHMTAIRMPINTGPYYLFLQDGIPVQSSGFFNHNGLAYTTFQTASSTEVLKGAGTSLYGSDAMAAVVNVKSSKKPSKEFESSIKILGGSNAYVQTSAEVSETLDKKNAYRANISYMHSDGWRDHTKVDRIETNIRYDYELTSDTDVKLLISASKTDAQQADSFNNYANITNASTAASDDANYFTALKKTDLRRKFDYARVSAEITNYSNDALEVIFTPYIRYNRNRYVATWEKNLPSNDNAMQTFGLMQKNVYEKSWGKIIFGFDSEYTQSSLQYNQNFGLTSGTLYDYNVDYLSIAPYLHSDYMLTKTLKLSAGLRYDYNSYMYTNNLQANSQDASATYYRPANRSDSYNHLSPKISLSYKAKKSINIYFRYANGFRIPQATRLYSVKVGYENINLTPETSDTYEIGVKKSFSKKSYFELAMYYMNINDTIVRDRDTGGYRNAKGSIHRGIETTLKNSLTEEVSVNLAYSYSMHNYNDDAKYKDNEVSGAPNHTGNLRFYYLPKVVKGLRIMAELQYTGSYWMDDAHSVEKYEGYKIGNLKADYEYTKKLKLFAKVTNLTDEKYATRARLAYGKADYTPGDPRQFYMGAEYKW